MSYGSEPGLRTSDRLEGIVGEGGKEEQNHSGEAGKGGWPATRSGNSPR